MQLVLFRVQIIEKLPDSLNFLVAFQNEPLLFFGQIAKRNVEANTPAHLFAELAEPLLAFGFCPGLDSPFVERKSPIGDDQILREINSVTETLADVDTRRRDY